MRVRTYRRDSSIDDRTHRRDGDSIRVRTYRRDSNIDDRTHRRDGSVC
jgi:hypothetical protein